MNWYEGIGYRKLSLTNEIALYLNLHPQKQHAYTALLRRRTDSDTGPRNLWQSMIYAESESDAKEQAVTKAMSYISSQTDLVYHMQDSIAQHAILLTQIKRGDDIKTNENLPESYSWVKTSFQSNLSSHVLKFDDNLRLQVDQNSPGDFEAVLYTLSDDQCHPKTINIFPTFQASSVETAHATALQLAVSYITNKADKIQDMKHKILRASKLMREETSAD